MKAYVRQPRKSQREGKRKKNAEEQIHQSNTSNNYYVVELRAVHGTFTLNPKDMYEDQNNCSSSGHDCVHTYNSKQHSLFNIKSHYAHVNWSPTQHSKKSNNRRRATKVTSYFHFPVSTCRRKLGYSKAIFM